MLDLAFFRGFKEAFDDLALSEFPNIHRMLIPPLVELNRAPDIVIVDSDIGHNDGVTRYHALYIRMITQNLAGEIKLWGLFGQLNDIIDSLPDSHPGHVFKGQPTLTLKTRLISYTRQPEQAQRVMTFTMGIKFKKKQLELKQVFIDLLMEAIATTVISGHQNIHRTVKPAR